MFSDELMEAIFNDSVNEALIRNAVRTATISRKLIPVFIGSAYKNIGVQAVLEGVNNYLPDPTEVINTALDLDHNEEELTLQSKSDLPLVALAFKLEVTPYGQLTYLRVYQGSMSKGDSLTITRTGKS